MAAALAFLNVVLRQPLWPSAAAMLLPVVFGLFCFFFCSLLLELSFAFTAQNPPSSALKILSLKLPFAWLTMCVRVFLSLSLFYSRCVSVLYCAIVFLAHEELCVRVKTLKTFTSLYSVIRALPPKRTSPRLLPPCHAFPPAAFALFVCCMCPA